MALEVEGKVFETDEEGFLLNPHDWNESLAQHIAHGEKLDLTEPRWAVVRYVREHFDSRGQVPKHATCSRNWANISARKKPRVNFSTNFFPMVTVSRPARSPACASHAN